MNPAPAPLSKGERLALGFAVASGLFFIARKILCDPLFFDALGYYQLAQNMVNDSVWGYRDFLRTYGTPLFLSWFFSLANILPLPPLLHEQFDMRVLPVILTGQMLLYFAASYALRSAVALFSLHIARYVFIGLCINIYVTSMMAEVLSEAPSLIFYSLMVGVFLQMLHGTHAFPRLPLPKARWFMGMGAILGFLVGFSAMLRPANYTFGAPLLASWLVLCVSLACARGAKGRLRCAAAILLGMVIGFIVPILPQLAINHVYFGNHSISSSEANLWWAQAPGVERMKFQSTFSYGALIARNPFLAGTGLDSAQPLKWYWEYPFHAAKLLPVKFFNLLDHDYFFTYTSDLHPWWRVPLSVFNHAAVGFAFIGLALWARRSSLRMLQADGMSLWMLLVFVSSAMALSLTTVGDMRYGILMLQVGFPLAVYAIAESAKDRRKMLRRIFGVAIYCVLALIMSEWVRYHTPQVGSKLGPIFEEFDLGPKPN